MPFWDFLIKRKEEKTTRAKLLTGSPSIFPAFGNNIYANDVVMTCVDTIAQEGSKFAPMHIRKANGIQEIPNSDLNRIFKQPNEFMTMRSFLEKIMWTLHIKYNCFIYPRYIYWKDLAGNTQRTLAGLYPLNPVNIELLEDATGTLFAKFYFQNNEASIIEYSTLIHLRKKFGFNDILGGGENGTADDQALLTTLSINNTILQGLDKAVKTSNQIKAFYKINSILDDDKKKAEQRSIEDLITSGNGIVAIDIMGDLHELKNDPKLIDQPTLSFVESKILRWWGVSPKMIDGTASDEEKEAFYEKVMEPIGLELSQAFTMRLLTPNEQNHGNEIVFYSNKLYQMSLTKRLLLIGTGGEQGLLTNDQKLEIIGLPPIGGALGAVRNMNLNWINVAIADQYQLARAKLGSAGQQTDGQDGGEKDANSTANAKGA